MVKSMTSNYELEYFRSTIKANYPHPPLLAVNMGPMGQLSRALNTLLSPITHPLLPMIAAPNQLSAAEINKALNVIGHLPARDIYAIGSTRSTSQSMFFEKCFNELGLPHSFSCVDRGPNGSVGDIVKQAGFGGAYVIPPLASSQPYINSLTEAAQLIGQIDTIVSRTDTDQQNAVVGDNATWRGIRATLTRDFVASAYRGRAALILANTEADAAPSIYALRNLNIGAIYTVGFKAQGPLATGLEPFSIESVHRVQQPFVIISALPPEKSNLVQPLLRHFGMNGKSAPKNGGKVFVDLAVGPRKGDPTAVATSAGWSAYGIGDVSARTTVETFRLLVGQNVPFDFVSMASGRGLC